MSDDDFTGFLPSGALQEYRDEIEKYPPLTDAETRLLFQKANIAKTDEEKKKLHTEIANSYLSFVVDIAESFTDIELILVDYIQEGNIALLESIAEYDVKSADSFLDFCLPRIQEAVLKYIEENPLPDNIGVQAMPLNKLPKGDQPEDERDEE